MPLLLPFIAAAAFVNGAVGAEVRISSASDLIQFSNNVNSGSTYYGSTVFLDSDIDLSGKTFEPIGMCHPDSSCNYIKKCVFDGRGHVIKNLAITTSSSKIVGFFGFVVESTIKNLVIDSSCSIDSQYQSSTSYAFVGGVVGDLKNSVLENIINIGSVKFSGDVSGYDVCIGGIIGYLYSYGYSLVVNCANHGSVTDSGKNAYSYASGIVGYLAVNQTTYIQNCLNYGSVAQTVRNSKYQYSGGIVGFSQYAVIENCMSHGKITAGNWFDYYIGSIVGKVYSSTSILHSFWTSNVGYGAVGTGSPSIDSQSSKRTLNADLVDDLNSYKAVWKNWLLNSNGDSVYFDVGTSSDAFVLTSKIILVPDIANFSYYIPSIECTITFVMSYGGSSMTQVQTFYYGKNIVFPNPTISGCTPSAWYEDSAFTKPFTETKATRDVTLYAKFAPKKYTVVFYLGDGSSKSLRFEYGESISYQTLPKREGLSFDGWYKDSSYRTKFTGTTVTDDMTLYAKWTTKTCTVKFYLGDGSSKSLRFEYGESISYPTLPEIEGLSFAGWYEDSSFTVRFIGTKVTDDMTLYARWVSDICTVVFDFGDGTSKSVDFECGDYISFPDTPDRVGYYFGGWYEDSSCTTVSTHTTVTKNMTLYGTYVDLKGTSGAHMGHSIMSVGATLFLALFLLILFP